LPNLDPRADTLARQRNRRIEIILTYRVKATR